jgi:hypothetical protein
MNTEVYDVAPRQLCSRVPGPGGWVKVHAVIDRGLTSLISRYTFNDTQPNKCEIWAGTARDECEEGR